MRGTPSTHTRKVQRLARKRWCMAAMTLASDTVGGMTRVSATASLKVSTRGKRSRIRSRRHTRVRACERMPERRHVCLQDDRRRGIRAANVCVIKLQ
jgi:hypothetical protein